MRRVLLVVCLSAVVAVGGCASHRPPACPDDGAPVACEHKPRPKWVQYDWWDEHPVLKGAVIAAGVAGFLAVNGVGLACCAVSGGRE